MTSRRKRAAPRSRTAKKPPVITLDELMRRLADPDEPDENIRPYLSARRDPRFGLAPLLLPNENVDEEATPAARARGDIGLGFLNSVYQSRRRRRFERRLRRRDPAPVLLAEGDSWFQYPAFLRDVIDHLEADHNICCLSAAGDELRAIVAQPEYRDHLDYLARVRKVRFAAFLFSAGGNDIVGNNMGPLLRNYDPAKPGAWHVNPTTFGAKMREVTNGYRSVLQSVRQLQPNLPILLHGYDYALPLPKQRFSIPPRDGWLGEPLRAREVPDGPIQAEIVRTMIDLMNAALTKIAGQFPGVHFVNNREAVKHGRWADELHPTDRGFADVANNFRSALRKAGVKYPAAEA